MWHQDAFCYHTPPHQGELLWMSVYCTNDLKWAKISFRDSVTLMMPIRIILLVSNVCTDSVYNMGQLSIAVPQRTQLGDKQMGGPVCCPGIPLWRQRNGPRAHWWMVTENIKIFWQKPNIMKTYSAKTKFPITELTKNTAPSMWGIKLPIGGTWKFGNMRAISTFGNSLKSPL